MPLASELKVFKCNPAEHGLKFLDMNVTSISIPRSSNEGSPCPQSPSLIHIEKERKCEFVPPKSKVEAYPYLVVCIDRKVGRRKYGTPGGVLVTKDCTM
jgi:hypothetical protein